MMASVVPVVTRDVDFYGRQRDLFPQWRDGFGEEWKVMKFDDSFLRFEKELERLRREMYRLDAGDPNLQVQQPFVTDAAGNRKMSLRFDCSQFKPEEISVQSQNDTVCVHATHDDDTSNGKVHREFVKRYTLPDNVDPRTLKSTLSKDGVLQIEAPAPPAVEAPKENLVPIEHL